MPSEVRIPRILGVCAAITMLTSCDDTTPRQTVVTDQFVYWQDDGDDFSGVERSYLDVTIWLREEIGQFLDLQFQCKKSQRAEFPTEFKVLLNSRDQSDDGQNNSAKISRVLYKRAHQMPQSFPVERNHLYNGYGNSVLDVSGLFAREINADTPISVDFRFVLDGDMYSTIDEIHELSGAPSVDLTVSEKDPEVAKMIEYCAS